MSRRLARKRYEATALGNGIPKEVLGECWRLYGSLNPIEEGPKQAGDLAHAYRNARRLAPAFEASLTGLQGLAHGRCESRPTGVKSLERMVEKYLLHDLVPVDILACKCVQPTLRDVYSAAAAVERTFQVVAFKDRFVEPQGTTGYRDLQFVVDAGGGHLAEVKVVHEILDALDEFEHKLYEIHRAPPVNSSPGTRDDLREELATLVNEGIVKLSRELYNEAWRRVLSHESSAW